VPKVRRLLQGATRIGGGAGVVLASLLLLIAVGRPAGAHPVAQAPIVSPEAVTTPAPQAPPVDAQGLSAAPWLTYTVQPGDTLLSVALEIGVDLDDMPCIIAPDFSPDHPLVIGNVLEMPPPGTLCHIVEPGDTVETISVRYRTPVEHLQAIDWNRLPPTVTVRSPLTPGLHLRVPLSGNLSRPRWDSPAGLASAEDFLTVMLHQPVNTPPFVAYAVGGSGRARVETGQVPANWPYGSGHFAWPLFGWLTQGYRYDHRAVDIAAPAGTLVTAADRGVVIRAGWNNQGYGRFVVIDHNIDYITLYAHLDEILVQEGMVVAQGQTIGRVGSTGNSTGPHLHFEIRDFGRLTNPLELLGK
jgi:murein DD-endopeptidase MepM/ murein hydrolase activator NlpD